jgi:hypothetical protein
MGEQNRTRRWSIRAMKCFGATVLLIFLIWRSGIGQNGQVGDLLNPAAFLLLSVGAIGFLATSFCLVLALVNWTLGDRHSNEVVKTIDQ